MAKLTQKQRAQLQSALTDLKRAHAFIMAGQIAVARRGTHAPTTLHYSRVDGKTLHEVTKEIGSDLTGLEAGIEKLEAFLA